MSNEEILKRVTQILDALSSEDPPKESTLTALGEKIALLGEGPYLDWLVAKGLDDWISTEQRAQALLVTLETLTKERS